MAKKKTRILISKLGLDGHDRGAKLVAHSLQEAGMDVTYLGIRHTVDEVVDKAIENKVDYLGLSFLAGDHLDRKSTRLNSSHSQQSRMPSSA